MPGNLWTVFIHRWFWIIYSAEMNILLLFLNSLHTFHTFIYLEICSLLPVRNVHIYQVCVFTAIYLVHVNAYEWHHLYACDPLIYTIFQRERYKCTYYRKHVDSCWYYKFSQAEYDVTQY